MPRVLSCAAFRLRVVEIVLRRRASRGYAAECARFRAAAVARLRASAILCAAGMRAAAAREAGRR